MTPKDLFQTGLRLIGVIFLYLSVPRALGELSTIGDSIRSEPFWGVIGLLFRIIWEVAVPLWLLCGAPRLTRALFN